MKIGDRIKQLRKELNMKRVELAQQIGVTYSALSKYETNEREPDYETLKKLARIFNVSIDYLVGYSNIRNPYEKDKLGIDGLSPDSRRQLEEIVQLLKLRDKIKEKNDIQE